MNGAESPQAGLNNSERCMKAAVVAFNALTGTALSEAQGWQLMTLLRLAHINGTSFDVNDYHGVTAYVGLASEAAARDHKEHGRG